MRNLNGIGTESNSCALPSTWRGLVRNEWRYVLHQRWLGLAQAFCLVVAFERFFVYEEYI